MIFAKIMKDKSNFKLFWKKLFYNYRVVVMTENSLEEKLALRLSKIRFFTLICLLCVVIVLFTTAIISLTPLSNYLPGKSSREVQSSLISLSFRSDSLEDVIKNRDLYIQSLSNVVTGTDLHKPEEAKTPEKNIRFESISLDKSSEDSLLRVAVELENKGAIYHKSKKKDELFLFYSPVEGIVVDGFNFDNKHYGVDVVAKENATVSSVLEGTVVASNWTPKTGYVLMIQHKNNYISVYKHNSSLFKEVGDFVLAGERVAIVGNSGELSSGPHLHFELWHKGIPVNPIDYISF